MSFAYTITSCELLSARQSKPGTGMTQSSVAEPKHSLAGVAILKSLPAERLKRVEQSCSWLRYEPGEPIVEYLDRSDDVFFLVSGEARVIVYSMAGRVVSFNDLAQRGSASEVVVVVVNGGVVRWW